MRKIRYICNEGLCECLATLTHMRKLCGTVGEFVNVGARKHTQRTYVHAHTYLHAHTCMHTHTHMMCMHVMCIHVCLVVEDMRVCVYDDTLCG